MSARRTTIRPHHQTLRLAAALVAIALLGPSKAEAAGCGRHVAPSADSVATVDGLRPGGGGVAEQGSTPGRPKAPCSGPECSEGRRPESPTPASVAPTVLREWGRLTIPDAPALAMTSAFATAESTLRPLHIPSRPERPPRPFA